MWQLELSTRYCNRSWNSRIAVKIFKPQKPASCIHLPIAIQHIIRMELLLCNIGNCLSISGSLPHIPHFCGNLWIFERPVHSFIHAAWRPVRLRDQSMKAEQSSWMVTLPCGDHQDLPYPRLTLLTYINVEYSVFPHTFSLSSPSYTAYVSIEHLKPFNNLAFPSQIKLKQSWVRAVAALAVRTAVTMGVNVAAVRYVEIPHHNTQMIMKRSSLERCVLNVVAPCPENILTTSSTALGVRTRASDAIHFSSPSSLQHRTKEKWTTVST